jgi:Ni/Fe-hydrogenase subunit HybB-like protein
MSAYAMFFRYRIASTVFPIALLICTCLLSLSKKIRQSVAWTIAMVILFNGCMFMETIWVFITSYMPDYVPSSWSYYRPSWFERLWPLQYTAIFIILTGMVFKIRQILSAKPTND